MTSEMSLLPRRTKRRRKLVGSFALIALAAVSVSLGQPSEARADPAYSDLEQYAISVPSSVLAAADSGVDTDSGVTPGQYGGLLANAYKFNDAWTTSTVGQIESGDVTTSPPDPSTLTTAQQADYGNLISTSPGAPATPVTELSKDVGEPDAIPILLAGGVGMVIGTAAENALFQGWVNTQLCAGDPGTGSIYSLLADVDGGENCAQVKTSLDLQTHANLDAGTMIRPGFSS